METVETAPGVFIRMKDADADRWRRQNPTAEADVAEAKRRGTSRNKARRSSSAASKEATAAAIAEATGDAGGDVTTAPKRDDEG